MKAALAIALALLASPATARPICFPTVAEMASALSKYGETAVGVGVSRRGPAIVLFAAESGSWSAVEVTPGGSACIIDHGDGWIPVRASTGAPA